MYKKLLLFSLILTLISILPIYGEPEENDMLNTPNEEAQEDKSWGIVPMGMPYYTPDTSGALVAYIVFYFNADPEDPAVKPSEISLFGLYTLRNQMSFGFSDEIYLFESFMKLSGMFAFAKYPQEFWGIGPDTSESMKETYTPLSFTFDQSFLFQVISNLYAGPAYYFGYVENRKIEENYSIDRGIYPGSNGAYTSGIGFNINWDSRDSIWYPTEGIYADGKTMLFRRELGGEFNYTSFHLDIRTFLEVYHRHILAFQFITKCNWGTIPFQYMPEIGGMEIMRGYLAGRYKDKNLLAGQLEYRFPIAWRFEGALFGAVANVAPAFDDFDASYTRFAWGPGLRFTVDEDQHINLRLDIGFNEDFEPSFYFIAKEAF